MKQLKMMAGVLVALFLLMVAMPVHAQKEAIEGIWLNQDKDAKIQIYKGSDGKYYGKIVWLREPNRDGKPKVDKNNVNTKLRTQPIMGLVILKSFVKKDVKSYEDGTVYDPKNGKTYDCNITVANANTLNVRGYVGISLIGRTTVWTRSE